MDSLTVGAAPGPCSPGWHSLQVGLEPGPGTTTLLLQRVQDVTDGAHQPSHVGLALREQLWVGGTWEDKELWLNVVKPLPCPQPFGHPAVRMRCPLPQLPKHLRVVTLPARAQAGGDQLGT